MKISLRYLFVILSFMLLLACGKTKEGKNSGPLHDPDVPENADSLYAEADKKEEQEKEEPVLDLATTELQLAYMRTSGNWDYFREGILPTMAEDAPEYCREILASMGKRFIIVDKAKMKLFLYDPFGNVEKSYGIACAKNYGTKHKKGDSRTTEGIFKVKGVFNSTEWLFTDDNGYTSPKKGQYGPRFIRLSIPYIGIHGTGSPSSIGKRCSHGCIRVTNSNIMELVEYVEEGMPVIISPGPRDMAVNKKEGYEILAVMTEPGGRAATAAWEDSRPKISDEIKEAEETGGVIDPEIPSVEDGSETEKVIKSDKMEEGDTPPEPVEVIIRNGVED